MLSVLISFSFYVVSLLLFSMISHPVYYCGLLVLNSLLSSLISYLVLGFSWYSLLFCLVYIGGVYILFVFVSVFSPNNSLIFYYKFKSFIIPILMVSFIMVSMFAGSFFEVEFSSFLCTPVEGNFYVLMCLMLVFGFVILSMVMGFKLNYYR